MSSSSSDSSRDGFPEGPSVSIFHGAHDFTMGKVKVNNIEGNYTDHRSYNTINDHSVKHSTVYHQENAKASIYNGNITGGVNTFSGGTITYARSGGPGRSKTSPAQMSSHQKKKKSTRPSGTYYQQGAQAPIYNGDIEGGVNSYNNANVMYNGQGSDSDSEENHLSRRGGRKGRDRHGHGERNDGPSYHQQRGWHPDNGAYSHQASGGSYYGGHGAYNPPGSGQYFDMPMVVDEPGEYPASEYPSSEYAASKYPESYNPPSTVGPSPSQWGSSPLSRRAGTWAPSPPFTSPPPTINTVPPSAPASSRGMRSPPMNSNGSRLPPIREGLRTPSPSIINAYPSPAPSQDGQPFEESYTKRTKNKVNNWLSTGSVSDGMERLSLDDKADQCWSEPTQFPLTPPESAHPTPHPTPQRTVSANNPFRALMQAQQAMDRRQTCN